MQNGKKTLEELFEKYRAGLVSEQEKEAIARWLIHLDLMEDNSINVNFQLQQQLRSQEELKNHFFPRKKYPIGQIHKLPLWFKSVAATVMIAIMAGAAFYLITKTRIPLTIASTYGEQITHKGEIKVLTLTDGTRITLNNESKVRYPLALQGKKREIYLIGEAFFNVVHYSDKPFIVHTEKLNVQVLGTSFDVKAYHEDKTIAVSVSSGKVGVTSSAARKNGQYFLLPGDQLVYNRNTAQFSRLKIDASVIAGWQTGVLTFNNEALINITHQLERVYNVSFHFETPGLRTKILSINLKNQSLAVVMKALGISGNFHYSINGDSVTIR